MISLINSFRNLLSHHALMRALALRDFQSKYAGTLGGALWAFAHPLAIVTIFYFVFAVGFRAQGPVGAPFVLWFVCGLVPWFFFNDTLQVITNSITSNTHLVKKTVFPTKIMPLVHLVSGLFPHAIFLLILIGMLVFFNIPFLAERLLVVYFLISTCVLLIGLGWMLSALQVFYRDISEGVKMFLNLWFWSTPIVWQPDIIPAEYRGLLLCNPMYYIIEGYRGLLIFSSPVWPSWHETAYFWSITVLAFLVGAYVFRRLKPEFADVV